MMLQEYFIVFGIIVWWSRRKIVILLNKCAHSYLLVSFCSPFQTNNSTPLQRLAGTEDPYSKLLLSVHFYCHANIVDLILFSYRFNLLCTFKPSTWTIKIGPYNNKSDIQFAATKSVGILQINTYYHIKFWKIFQGHSDVSCSVRRFTLAYEFYLSNSPDFWLLLVRFELSGKWCGAPTVSRRAFRDKRGSPQCLQINYTVIDTSVYL